MKKQERKDRNIFIVEEFLDGASVMELARHEKINIKYGAIRRVIIQKIGKEEYQRISRWNKADKKNKAKTISSTSKPRRKGWLAWLLGE